MRLFRFFLRNISCFHEFFWCACFCFYASNSVCFCFTIHILWSVGWDLHLKGSYATLGFVETKDSFGFWIRPESSFLLFFMFFYLEIVWHLDFLCGVCYCDEFWIYLSCIRLGRVYGLLESWGFLFPIFVSVLFLYRDEWNENIYVFHGTRLRYLKEKR